jgi:hypothetical protein
LSVHATSNLYHTPLISILFVYQVETQTTILFKFALVVPHKAFERGFSKSVGVTISSFSFNDTHTRLEKVSFKVHRAQVISTSVPLTFAFTFSGNTTGNLPILDIFLVI